MTNVYEWTNEEIAAALAAYQSAPDTAKAGDLRALMDQARRSVQFTPPPPTDLAGVRAHLPSPNSWSCPMTDDEVLAEFAKLPLPQKMRAAADVVEEAERRHSPSVTNPSVESWDAKGDYA